MSREVVRLNVPRGGFQLLLISSKDFGFKKVFFFYKKKKKISKEGGKTQHCHTVYPHLSHKPTAAAQPRPAPVAEDQSH